MVADWQRSFRVRMARLRHDLKGPDSLRQFNVEILMAGEEIVRIGSEDPESEVRHELDHHLIERQRRY